MIYFFYLFVFTGWCDRAVGPLVQQRLKQPSVFPPSLTRCCRLHSCVHGGPACAQLSVWLCKYLG